MPTQRERRNAAQRRIEAIREELAATEGRQAAHEERMRTKRYDHGADARQQVLEDGRLRVEPKGPRARARRGGLSAEGAGAVAASAGAQVLDADGLVVQGETAE